jgi:hypothetical protein
MTRFRALLAGAALAALAFTGLLWAQTSTIVQNLTGNELVTIQTGSGGPGGSSFFTTLNAIRNASGYIAVGAGGTVNTTIPATASMVIGTGAITTWNITFPTAPYDGQIIQVACPAGGATVAMTATLPSGVAIVGTAFTACTAGGAATGEWVYSTSANSWYRVS